MKIEILGKGCAKCVSLEENVIEALEEIGKEAQVEHIKDMNKITEYGVMITPTLVIDGEVKSSGKVLNVEKLKELLS